MSFLTGIRKVCVPAPAKINLFLSVGGKRKDGFHELRTVLAKVKLYDILTIERTSDSGKTEVLCPGFPELENEGNLAAKLVTFWREQSGCNNGIRISIIKKIPMEAGLGGGSSDAVATLIGLNALSSNKLSFVQLWDLCVKVGSDCPSFLISGTCVASGRGEIVRGIDKSLSKTISGKRVLLFKPPCGFPTAQIYTRFRNSHNLSDKMRKMDLRIKEWERGKLTLLKFIHNDFITPIQNKFFFMPVLFDEIRERFDLKAIVSGSGSCSFMIVPDEMDLRPVKQVIRDAWGEEAFLMETHLV